MSVTGKNPSVIDGRISALRPDFVRNPVLHAPTWTVLPRPKEGSHPSQTAKMRMRKIPMRKLGSYTPISEVVSTARAVQPPRFNAV